MDTNLNLPPTPGTDSEKGFAFIMALLSMLLLTSLGLLVFSLTVKDQIISARLAAEKKAFSAAENGVAQVLLNFVPGRSNSDVPDDPAQWPAVNANTDANTRFYYAIPARPVLVGCPPPPGCNLDNCTGACYEVDVRGANINFTSQQQLFVGIRTGVAGSTSDSSQK